MQQMVYNAPGQVGNTCDGKEQLHAGKITGTALCGREKIERHGRTANGKQSRAETG